MSLFGRSDSLAGVWLCGMRVVVPGGTKTIGKQDGAEMNALRCDGNIQMSPDSKGSLTGHRRRGGEERGDQGRMAEEEE